jgi:OFA family oxalate/formate antiporter-like MFS transporter
MPKPPSTNRIYVVLSASILAMVLGSVHAFSVFLEPLEAQFNASRSSVSLTYSFALVTLTIAVLWGHKLYAKWPAKWFVLGICILAGFGAAVAAYAPSLSIVWLGYSLMFGVANGLGYGFGLQIVAQAYPGREGVLMGIATASYGLGAALSPALFAWFLTLGEFQGAMIGLASILFGAGIICSVLMARSGVEYKKASQEARAAKVPTQIIVLLWLAYGAGVGAGLMAIGHAAGIAKSLGITGAVWVTPVWIAVCNMCGSLVGGWLVDRVGARRLLIILPLLSAIGLSVLVFQTNFIILMICFGFAGFSYGAVIAAYPAVIAKMFAKSGSVRIYGLVFTAWGTTGLLTPWLAGYIYDSTGGYSAALITAACLGIISMAMVQVLYRTAANRGL